MSNSKRSDSSAGENPTHGLAVRRAEAEGRWRWLERTWVRQETRSMIKIQSSGQQKLVEINKEIESEFECETLKMRSRERESWFLRAQGT